MRYFITFYAFPSNGQTKTGVLITTNNKGNRVGTDYLISRISQINSIRESVVSVIETAEISEKEFDRIKNK